MENSQPHKPTQSIPHFNRRFMMIITIFKCSYLWEAYDTIFNHSCADATALAKIGIDRGLQPDISSPFINKDLLKSANNFSYEGVNEILDALAVADRNNSGLLGKL